MVYGNGLGRYGNKTQLREQLHKRQLSLQQECGQSKWLRRDPPSFEPGKGMGKRSIFRLARLMLASRGRSDKKIRPDELILFNCKLILLL